MSVIAISPTNRHLCRLSAPSPNLPSSAQFLSKQSMWDPLDAVRLPAQYLDDPLNVVGATNALPDLLDHAEPRRRNQRHTRIADWPRVVPHKGRMCEGRQGQPSQSRDRCAATGETLKSLRRSIVKAAQAWPRIAQKRRKLQGCHDPRPQPMLAGNFNQTF